MNGIRELGIDELEQVNGGLVFIPIAIAFGKGALQGAAVVGLGVLALDALGVIE